MEETGQENPNDVNITITVEGLTPESADIIAQQFIAWLDNSGEQVFWQDTAMNVDFRYNVHDNKYTPWIVIAEQVDGMYCGCCGKELEYCEDCNCKVEENN